MTAFEALLLGIVEGLTEFLPVSSTGHLILTAKFLNIGEANSTKAFEVVIQSGAIIAVLWHYRVDLARHFQGVFHGHSESWALVRNLFIAFLPAALTGILFHTWIKTHLFGVAPVIAALALGGIAMIYLEKKLAHGQSLDATELSPKMSLQIGLAQCFALWPGTSRSMATILGARWVGLSPAAAAEFSFLLALPTLMAATGLDLYKHGTELIGPSGPGLQNLIIGILSSFVVALLVIKGFIKWLNKRGLSIFGWYRLALALVVYLIVY